MDRTALLLGNNRPEDVKWLFSLSESELDFLISLKKIAIRRAEIVGHEALANKFDLKALRMIGYVLMQHVKNRVAVSPTPGLSESAKLLASSKLIKLDLKSGIDTTESAIKKEIKDELLWEDELQIGTRLRTKPKSGDTPKSKRHKCSHEYP